jgi:phage terminase large subunit-like protein
MTLKPQPGPQERYLASRAFFTLFGGARGGGKTFGAGLDMHRYVTVPKYRGCVIRRLYPDMIASGGVWETMSDMSRQLGARVRESPYDARWPNGAAITFRNMQLDKDVERLRSSQFDRVHLEECDELTEPMFWGLIQCMRAGPAGIKPRMRANCNPVVSRDHWLAKFVEPYLTADGYPDPLMAGVIRHFKRDDDNGIAWTDESDPDAMSFTFIPSTLSDNAALTERDPAYERNLRNLTSWERDRMLGGKWFSAPVGGMLSRGMFRTLDARPAGVRWIRYWDHAATEPTPTRPEPDWTVGTLVGMHDGLLVIADQVAFREGPHRKREYMKNTADADGEGVDIVLEQEPGSAGVETFADYQTRVLEGYTVHPDRVSANKHERANPWLAWLQSGNVAVVRGAWNAKLFDWIEQYPGGKMDAIDSISGGYAWLTKPVVRGDVFSGSVGNVPVSSSRSLSFSGGVS